MARISLLFSLALVLAIGSVLAHPPTHKKLQKTLCPSTLSKVQAFPYLEVSSFVEKKVQFAPKTIAFKSLFSICKSYIDFLEGVKFSASRDVFHVVHVKFTLMTKAMVIAQAHIGVEGDLAVKLGKSYTVMAERFVNLLEMMSTVSAKYKFDANAKISASESAEIEKCVMKLKSAIRSYVKVISQCSTKFSAGKSIGFPTYPVGFIGGIAKQGLGYAGKFVGAHGQVGAGFEIGAKAKVGVQSEKFLEYGPITKPKGRVGVQGEVKVGGQVHAAGKAKVRAQVEAKVGGETGSGYYDGIMKYFGKGHFDAAGKAHVSGGSGFRPLSNPHKKHLD